MTAISATSHQRPAKSLVWWLAVVLWATVGLLLVAAVVKQQGLGQSMAAVDDLAPAAPTTDAASPSEPVRVARSQGEMEVSAVLNQSEASASRLTDLLGRQAWADDGPTSDFQHPSNGWGSHDANCPSETFLVYGARTEPRKYEYVVCSAPDGQLTYHGIDVDSGAEIRLAACVVEDGLYRAVASADYRYEVADMRPESWDNGNISDGATSGSLITLYRSATDVDWQYGVASEWGMQNLPTEFTKC